MASGCGYRWRAACQSPGLRWVKRRGQKGAPTPLPGARVPQGPAAAGRRASASDHRAVDQQPTGQHLDRAGVVQGGVPQREIAAAGRLAPDPAVLEGQGAGRAQAVLPEGVGLDVEQALVDQPGHAVELHPGARAGLDQGAQVAQHPVAQGLAAAARQAEAAAGRHRGGAATAHRAAGPLASRAQDGELAGAGERAVGPQVQALHRGRATDHQRAAAGAQGAEHHRAQARAPGAAGPGLGAGEEGELGTGAGAELAVAAATAATEGQDAALHLDQAVVVERRLVEGELARALAAPQGAGVVDGQAAVGAQGVVPALVGLDPADLVVPLLLAVAQVVGVCLVNITTRLVLLCTAVLNGACF